MHGVGCVNIVNSMVDLKAGPLVQLTSDKVNYFHNIGP
jgi:hypothetical protein